MDRSLTVWSVIAFIESRVGTSIDYADIEKAVGFSQSHLRNVFASSTGVPLARYILQRRVARAAFDIIHGSESILSIACKYGFTNPDTFTRAFKRATGLNPREFRRRRPAVGRSRLCAGIFGVTILDSIERINGKDDRRDMVAERKRHESEGSTILYGVPKVGYGVYGCTPFPICLKAAANYLGEDVDYAYVMSECGAAFRLTWDTMGWNPGNVDVCFSFDDENKVYSYGIEGLGREYKAILRNKRTTKNEFVAFIKEQIDKGFPCIATRIVGPQETCIIAGYRDDGDTLLGWNFFQDSPEFRAGLEFDESGYFISKDWWENPDSRSVMSFGEIIAPKRSAKDIISTAVEVLSGRQAGPFAKGIEAYEAWKKTVANDRNFSVNLIMPALFERLVCQGDAMDCLHDGRYNAALYMGHLAEEFPQYKDLCLRIKTSFEKVVQGVIGMAKALGGYERGEAQARTLAQPEARQKICSLIDDCKNADEEALAGLKALLEKM